MPGHGRDDRNVLKNRRECDALMANARYREAALIHV
jgi:hypothetical protein